MQGNVLLWIVTVLYGGQAGLCIRAGQYAQALILAGYVVANVGLIWSLKP